MNEKLQFSWGHIVAFIAIIAISYFSFMGYTYLSNGNYMVAIAGAVLTDVLFLLVFLGAQMMKASGKKIARKIIWERVILFVSPLLFVVGMIAFSHFWTVKSQDKEISEHFVGALNNSRQLFSDYDTYASLRLKQYNYHLDNIIANKSQNPQAFKQAGFEDGKEKIQKENMLTALNLMLNSKSYEDLKNKALVWIDKANEGANTWNIFLLGNQKEIKETLGNWERELKEMSQHHLSNETAGTGDIPEFTSSGAAMAIEGLDSMADTLQTQKFPTVAAIFFGIVLYLMLILPYFIQQRHGRQVAMGYSLFKKGDESDFIEPSSGGKLKRVSIDVNEAQVQPNPTAATVDNNTAEVKETPPSPPSTPSSKDRKFKRITLD